MKAESDPTPEPFGLFFHSHLDTQNLQQVPKLKITFVFWNFHFDEKWPLQGKNNVNFADLSISLDIKNDIKSSESVPAVIKLFWAGGDLRSWGLVETKK